MRVTARRAAAKPRGMPPMTKEARAAYAATTVRAAFRSVRAEMDKSWGYWANKAGISPGSLTGFINGTDDEQTMTMSAVVRLAWAAEVPVWRLIGAPPPPAVESYQPGLVEQLRREREWHEQMLKQAQRIEELGLRLEAAEREASTLRQALAARSPND